MEINIKVRDIRKKRGLSIRELSEKTGLSAGFISNLERGETSPSIANLQIICDTLNVEIVDLLKVEKESTSVVRKASRVSVFKSPKDGVEYLKVSPTISIINGICVELEKGKKSKKTWKHSHNELGVVIKGSLEIEVEGEGIYLLEEGDSIFIKAGARHKHSNPSNCKSISYWFSVDTEKLLFNSY